MGLSDHRGPMDSVSPLRIHNHPMSQHESMPTAETRVKFHLDLEPSVLGQFVAAVLATTCPTFHTVFRRPKSRYRRPLPTSRTRNSPRIAALLYIVDLGGTLPNGAHLQSYAHAADHS